MTASFSQPIICPVLVGRDEALAGLRHLLAQAGARGKLVLIAGEAGVGKSRLLRELCGVAENAGYRLFQARFFEQDASLPYSAFSRLLADLAGADEAAPALLPLARELLPIAPELARLATASAEPEAIDQHGEQEKRRIGGALTKLVRALAAGRPMLLAFEDLHWADAASLEAMLQIARDAAPGCLIVLTYRRDEAPAQLDALLAQLDRERLSSELRLERLSLADVERVLQAILGGGRRVRADFLHVMYQLTGGNPFFVEEVLRSLLDQAGSREALSSRQLDSLDVPRGVTEALQRRRHGLSEAADAILSVAAVAGTRFNIPLLKAITRRGEEELYGLIRELIAAQLVVEEGEDRFAFRHALTREAIRSGLLLHERRSLSRRIGEAMERLHADDLDGVLEDLAWHFHEARDWERSGRYSRLAGERAMALYAPAAALGHLSRAIEAGEAIDTPGLAEVRRLRGAANEAIGDFDAARTDYERAVQDARAAGDDRTLWRSLLDLGLLWAARDYSQSEPHFRAAIEIARRLDDPAALGHSLNRLGNWYSNAGDLETARRMSQEALATFREAADTVATAQTLDLLGITCYLGMEMAMGAAYYREAIALLETLNDRLTLASALASIQIGSATYQSDMAPPALSLKEGSEFGERGLALARRAASRPAEAYALWQTAFALGPQGEYERALAYARQSLAIAKEIEHTQWETGAACALGAVLMDVLALDAAKPQLDRAVELSQEMASGLWLGQSIALLIDWHLARGDSDVALRLFGTSTFKEPLIFGPRQLFVSGAEVMLARGELAEALAMLERLEAEAERSVPGGVALRLARLRGRALAASGDLEGAIEQLRRADDAAEAQGNLSYAWRLKADLAQSLLPAGDREAARAAAGDAMDVVDRLAAQIPDKALSAGFAARAMESLPGVLRRRHSRDGVAALTAREAEIAGLIARGLTNREIAGQLVLSARTVETHVANATAKLGFSSRTQLAAWAVEHGLLSADS